MNRDEKLKLKRKLNVTDLAGEKVMIDFETGKYFLIKGVGNDIWDMLQEEITPAQIIENLLAEYAPLLTDAKTADGAISL